MIVKPPGFAGGAARRRRGFTLIFVIVIAAIMTVLMAVVATTLARYVSTDNAQTAVAILTEISTGVGNFFTKVVNTYPNRLAELADPIVNGNASYHNSCGNNFNGGQVTNWNTNGPFVPFFVTPQTKSAVYTPDGFINDTMIRSIAGANAGFLETQINGITLEDAQIIDDLVDGTVNAATGTVKYGSAAGGFADGVAVNDTLTLTFWVAIGAHC